ncbi:S8 family serine peptidase [Halorarius halobius]|uniref:S8 family serine peptidase n=1 Tax=Halorarius halobius TaxID=2962671 RepID=UPI0020CE1A4A|nr:S8 family serine peptidase [Halorarius halobius]
MVHNDRRTFLKTAGAAGVGLTFAGGASASEGNVLDDALDLTSDVVQDVLLVVDREGVTDELASLGLDVYEFEVLPLVYLEASGPTLEEVSLLDGVVRVEANRDLEWFNDDAREVTGVDETDPSYSGDSAHVAVIDSGVDPTHPDLDVATNYQWVGNPLGSPTLFVPSPVDTDEIGHGTHCSGTVAGTGAQSDGQYKGMAPDATLTVYSTSAGVSVLKAAAAYDHLLANEADAVDIVSNSYGAASASDFDPSLPINVATEAALEAGLLSVFACGNSGPGYDTLNDYAKAPWVLGVGATNDDRAVTGFSSRGRQDGAHDRSQALSDGTGLYRPGVCAPGASIVSTMGPTDPLQATDNGGTESLASPYYAAISGTSMSTPCVAGICARMYDAARENGQSIAPLDVIATLEDTADGSYEPASGGRGFVDADAVVSRAASGDLSSL